MQRISDSIRRQLGLAGDRPYFEGFDPEDFPVPAFVVDRAALQYNLDILASVAHQGGGHVLAALKAFSLPALLGQISASLDGATASGLYEARLAREQGFSSVHVFGPAYTDNELAGLLTRRITSSSTLLHNGAGSVPSVSRPGRQGVHARGWPTRSVLRNPDQSRTQRGSCPPYDPCATKPDGNHARCLGMQLHLRQRGPVRLTLDGISDHFHNLCEQLPTS